MAGEEEEEAAAALSLLHTPTWALATVCFVFIFFGIFIEHLIHLVGHWLKKHKKAALYDAMEKLKSVLMLLGFMSLLLTVTQRSILKICVPDEVANSMLPCRRSIGKQGVKHLSAFRHEIEVDEETSDHCSSKDMTPLMTEKGINQLNIFIFVLASIQVVSSVATMALGRAKMKRWKTWEKETQTLEYIIANDPERFRFTRDTTFGRRHANSADTNPAQLWILCFLRQFFNSVAKIDYLTLRHGFVTAHFPSTSFFNFQKYIQRSLEDDFKAVIGISPVMWLLVVIFLVLDVHGWNAYLWISFLPLIIVLFIGTKLGVIVAKMANRLTNQNTVIRGTPLVQPNNNLFWFKSPRLVLRLLHFALFMNTFEFAFFLWVTWQFGIESCYHEYVVVIVVRVMLAVLVQMICSYVTLPLYALVTQMGSQYKRAMVEENTTSTGATRRRRRRADLMQEEEMESSSPQFDLQNNSSTVEINNGTTSHHLSSEEQTQYMTSFVSLSGTTHEIKEDVETYYQYHSSDATRMNAQNEIELDSRSILNL